MRVLWGTCKSLSDKVNKWQFTDPTITYRATTLRIRVRYMQGYAVINLQSFFRLVVRHPPQQREGSACDTAILRTTKQLLHKQAIDHDGNAQIITTTKPPKLYTVGRSMVCSWKDQHPIHLARRSCPWRMLTEEERMALHYYTCLFDFISHTSLSSLCVTSASPKVACGGKDLGINIEKRPPHVASWVMIHLLQLHFTNIPFRISCSLDSER